IIIWRDELNEGKIFLRDIIDLEATYAGPDAKAMPATPGATADGPAVAGPGAAPPPPKPAPATAPSAATPFVAKADDDEDGEAAEPPMGEGEMDDDDLENSLSLAAIEAELKPKVVETFDNVADSYKRLRRLQDQDIQFQLKN